MQKTSLYNDKNPPNPEFFTGKVRMNQKINQIKTNNYRVLHVSFFNGARTKLHKHTGPQVLVVTRGVGSVVFYNKIKDSKGLFGIKKTKEIKIKQGDVIRIPSNKLHTHGASNKTIFSHIAMNEFSGATDNYQTIWYDSDFKNRVTKIIS